LVFKRRYSPHGAINTAWQCGESGEKAMSADTLTAKAAAGCGGHFHPNCSSPHYPGGLIT